MAEPKDPSDVLRVLPPQGAPVPLRYVEEKGRYLVIPTGEGSAWSTAALRTGGAEVERAPGGIVPCHAELLTRPEELERARAAFRRKYGEDLWEHHFASSTKVLVLDPGRPKGPPLDPVAMALQEFEAVSSRYSEVNLRNPFARRLKRRSVERMLPLFRDRGRLLEIGGGTGLETLPLLQAGHRVTVVDLSPRMLEELRSRAEAAGLGKGLETVEGRLGELEEVLADRPPGSFEGAFSTFGAMNLEPELASVPRALHRALRPGAPLFLGVLGPAPVVAQAFEVAARKPRQAAARLAHLIPAGALANTLDLHVPRLAELQELFRSRFQLERVEAASLLSPPWPSPRLLSMFSSSGLDLLDRWDRSLSRTWPWAHLGEWLFLTFRRTLDPAEGAGAPSAPPGPTEGARTERGPTDVAS